jgi:hypothetical protein
LPRALLVSRLLLSPLVTHDTLIVCSGRTRLGPWHAFLAAMFAASILRAFQIVFPRHSDQTFS